MLLTTLYYIYSIHLSNYLFKKYIFQGVLLYSLPKHNLTCSEYTEIRSDNDSTNEMIELVEIEVDAEVVTGSPIIPG